MGLIFFDNFYENIFFLQFIFLVGCNNSTDNSAASYMQEKIVASNRKGEILFKANCATCHKPAEPFVGPALKGVASRWESKELLYAFVKNSQEVIGRNAYAKKLFEEYRQSPMLPYPNLNDEDIQNVLDYCDSYK
jgi:cytochrome c551/c552